MEKHISDEIIHIRKLTYKQSLKGHFLAYSEGIHDEVRKGQIYRLNSPLSVFWAVTDLCNLNCCYCYTSANKNQKSQLSLAECYSLICELCKQNVCEIIIEGGEPLLHPDILEIISYIKNRGIIVTILTNATKLDHAFAEKLFRILDHRYDTIQVSLDGGREATDSQRGAGTYDKVMSNLESLKRHNLQWDNMIINCVVTQNSFQSIGEMCRALIQRTNINKVHFSPVFGSGSSLGIISSDFNVAHGEYKKIFDQYSQHIDFSGYFIPDKILLKDEDIWSSIRQNAVALGCCAGRSKLFIAPNGMCYPCTFLRDKKFCIGKFPEKNISEIWDAMEDEPLIKESYELSNYVNKDGKYCEYCAMARTNAKHKGETQNV